MSLLDFDMSQSSGLQNLPAGLDEAGRGPVAGPVTAAAVIFPRDVQPNPLIRDSKTLSEKQRSTAFQWILEHALSHSIRSLGVRRIEEMNILAASLQAMKEAAEELQPRPQLCLIDGNRLPPGMDSAKAVVKGDAASFSIAAASILAKVHRDRLMARWAQIFPGYGLEKHKGYPTVAHVQAIHELLPLPIHRSTFTPLKEFKFPRRPDPLLLGRWGENWAIHHLISRGWRFLERNTVLGRQGELDIVMAEGELLHVVEVKTSGPTDRMDPLEWINEKKIHRLQNLAEHWARLRSLQHRPLQIDALTVRCTDWRRPQIDFYPDISTI